MRCFFNINGWQIIVMTNELVNYYNSDSSGLQDPATLSFFLLNFESNLFNFSPKATERIFERAKHYWTPTGHWT